MKTSLKRKNLYLDEGKIRRAGRILGTQTEAETIDRALDLVVFRKAILRSLEQTAGKGWGAVACAMRTKKAEDKADVLSH